MKTILLTLAMFGTVLGMSVLTMQYAIYREQQSASGLEAAHRLKEAIRTREELDARVTALSADRCEAPVRALLALNHRQAIIGYRDIPSDLASDIGLCMKRDIIAPRFQDQLTDSDLMRFFA